jgi:acyl dehydratase
VTTAEGPYFDELTVGRRFVDAPAYTLSEGRAAVHQSIVGDRLRLPLDDPSARAVAGRSPLAHPAFVWDVAIGQSTVVTQHVRANLFYRNLAFRRLPALGDTLHTVTTVAALRQNTRRPGRRPTGLAALRIVTVDQEDRPVLDFYRCAMLPLRDDVETGHRDDLDVIGAGSTFDYLESVADWKVPAVAVPTEGERIEVAGGDVVSNAPELARLTLNVAQVHHDAEAAGGRRLVYGGHTIGIALSQASRALPGLLTVLAWHGCDHVGPVHEGDTLRSVVTVEKAERGSGVVHLRSLVTSDAGPVLDWRFVALCG